MYTFPLLKTAWSFMFENLKLYTDITFVSLLLNTCIVYLQTLTICLHLLIQQLCFNTQNYEFTFIYNKTSYI